LEAIMQARIHIVTLGVRDFERAVRFYRDGLGWPMSSASAGDIAFFKLGPVILALYPWDKLAEDACVPAGGSGFRGVTLAHNVARREDVDAVLAQAVAAGATLMKPAQDVFWGGYSGYFADPEGQLWEVCWNPHASFGPDGSLQFP
jgi:catechol 2,3-dioxygenase-like lactoylglutathione lyase family enzyme